PAQNALSPAPVSTMTRTSLSSWASRYPWLMPATTSALMALRLSGRLMVIQNACPRFSRITLLMSFIVPLACPLLLCNHLRQDGAALQAGIQGAAPTPAETSTENQRSLGPG